MTESELIKEAFERGYHNAARIKPSHVDHSLSPTILEIPAECIIEYIGNSLYFRKGSTNSFKEVGKEGTWMGCIYSGGTGKWAEIVSYREPKQALTPLPALRDFPSRGVCWNPTEALLTYLKNRNGNSSSGLLLSFSDIGKGGIAWNDNGLWKVAHSSAQTEYDISQLLPFLSPQDKNIRMTPLTPDECYKDTTTEILPGDRVVYDRTGEECYGIQGIVDEVYPDKHTGKLMIRLRRPLPRHPGGGELLSYLAEKARLVNAPAPEAWCIMVTKENIDTLDSFLRVRKDEYKGYSDHWSLTIGYYFNYPQRTASTHSSEFLPDNRTLVTLNQILHVLTENNKNNNLKINENDKENINTSTTGLCKIQRPNLTIRRKNLGRTARLRCPNSKIKCRAVNLPSTSRLGKGQSKA